MTYDFITKKYKARALREEPASGQVVVGRLSPVSSGHRPSLGEHSRESMADNTGQGLISAVNKRFAPRIVAENSLKV
jgi:hypothetical protein